MVSHKFSFPLPLAALPLPHGFSCDSLCSPEMESLPAGYTDIYIMVEGTFLPPNISVCKITRVWGAKSSLALDISSLNLVNLLVFIKSWKEMWKSLLYICDDHPCLFGRESPSRLKAVLGCKWLLSQHQLGLLL